MAASLDDLVPEFRGGAVALLQACAARGVTMRPNEALRDPFKQAIYWRQSRSTEQVRAKIAEFYAAGADFLAHCLERVGPRHGDPVTKAPPGLSWHQWGEALDCFWRVNGRAEWSTTRVVNGVNGYRVYREEARRMGLEAGGYWSDPDWPHVQLRTAASPRSSLSLRAINDEMRRRFG